MVTESIAEPALADADTITLSSRPTHILSPAEFYQSLQTGPEGIALAVYHGTDAFVFGGRTRPFALGDYCLYQSFTTTGYGTLPHDHVLIPDVMYARLWLLGVSHDAVQQRLIQGLGLPEAQVVPFNHNGFQDPESGLFADFATGSPLEFALMFEHHLLLTHKVVSPGAFEWDRYQHTIPRRGAYQPSPATSLPEHPAACSPCGIVSPPDGQ